MKSLTIRVPRGWEKVIRERGILDTSRFRQSFAHWELFPEAKDGRLTFLLKEPDGTYSEQVFQAFTLEEIKKGVWKKNEFLPGFPFSVRCVWR